MKKLTEKEEKYLNKKLQLMQAVVLGSLWGAYMFPPKDGQFGEPARHQTDGPDSRSGRGESMKCPYCGFLEDRVVDSREIEARLGGADEYSSLQGIARIQTRRGQFDEALKTLNRAEPEKLQGIWKTHFTKSIEAVQQARK